MADDWVTDTDGCRRKVWLVESAMEKGSSRNDSILSPRASLEHERSERKKEKD
jgi:hypothetical protein